MKTETYKSEQDFKMAAMVLGMSNCVAQKGDTMYFVEGGSKHEYKCK